MKKVIGLTLTALMVAGLASAQTVRLTESARLGEWTMGATPPTVQSGLRGDGTTGDYHYLPTGTSAYYFMVESEGEGSVEFWVYDPFNCTSDAVPTTNNGPRWGLQNPSYASVSVGIARNSTYLAGCLGYSPWCSAVPYSFYWFKDGSRGTNDVPFQAGWYKWTVNGTYDDISFTMHDVTYYVNDGPGRGTPVTGNCVQTYNSSNPTGNWAAQFGNGWKALWFKGDGGGDAVEDIKIDVTAGTGVFENVVVSISKAYNNTSWGSIKALYR